jgi:Flp pilus assembly protein TadG
MRTDRRGSAAFEALFVIPILLVVLLAVVEFAMLLAAEQKLAEASGVGARTGSLGRSDDDVREAVKAVMGTKQYEKGTIDIRRWNHRHTGAMIEVRVQLPAAAASPNVLRSVGIDLSDDTLTGRTVMRVE